MIAEMELGKPEFKLAPPEHDQLFDITALDLCESSISDVALRQIICQVNPPAQNRAATV